MSVPCVKLSTSCPFKDLPQSLAKQTLLDLMKKNFERCRRRQIDEAPHWPTPRWASVPKLTGSEAQRQATQAEGTRNRNINQRPTHQPTTSRRTNRTRTTRIKDHQASMRNTHTRTLTRRPKALTGASRSASASAPRPTTPGQRRPALTSPPNPTWP